MFFMQPAHYPVEPFTVYVKPCRMHTYTLIQLGLFVLLYVVKAIKVIAIAFPLIIACCIPIRLYMLPRIFTQEELIMLDSDEATIKAWVSKKQKDFEVEEAAQEEEVVSPMEEEHEKPKPDEERADQATPLPDIASAAASRRRRTRRKTVSCPPHMLFAEVPMEVAQVEISTIIEEEREEEPEEEEESKEEEAVEVVTEQLRRRKSRKKSLSCPPHMLFREAEKQVASNYFFG